MAPSPQHDPIPSLSLRSRRPTFAADSRVLIVDDHHAVLALICQVVEEEGYQAVTASSFDEALAALDEGVWLMVSDIELADRSGIELMEAARAQRRLLPVVCMSANPFALGEASRRGADAVLIKPFGLSELRAVLQLIRIATSQSDPER